MSRRSFTQALAAAGAVCGAGPARAEKPASKFLFGLCTTPDKAADLKALGYDYIECGVANVLKPGAPDAEFAAEQERLRACALPVRSCNGFIPANFRLTGPDANHEPPLAYAEKACQRADAAGIPFIVFGSGGARKMPPGFDPAQGRDQFIGFCRTLADRIKGLKVTLVLEPLNQAETNLLHTVTEGAVYVDSVGSPRIRLLADFFHMLKEQEGPEALLKAGPRLLHCHIAEKEGRMYPGCQGEDFRGYFKALRDIGYQGGISCECSWPKENTAQAWQKALDTLRQQASAS